MQNELARAKQELWQQIQALFQQGNLVECRKLLKLMCRRDRSSADARIFLGVVNERLEKNLEAIHCYEQAIELQPGYPEAHYNLGNLLGRQGRYEDARQALGKALQIRPDYAEAHNACGLVESSLGNIDVARSAFDHAIRVNPDFAEAWFNLGNLHQSTGNHDSAIDAYEKAERLAPGSPAVAANMGSLLASTGANEAAEEWLQRALMREPANGIVLNNLAGVAINDGRFEDALEYCDRAAATSVAKEASLMFNRGKALAGLMRFDEANDWLTKAGQANPEFLKTLWSARKRVPTPDDTVYPELSAESVFGVLLSQRLNACDWSSYDERVRMARQLVDGASGNSIPAISPFLSLHLPLSQASRSKLARQRSTFVSSQLASAVGSTGYSYREKTGERLRIGYVSGDFGNHATAQLSRSLYRLHDRDKFEVYGYSLADDDGSSYFSAIREHCDQFEILSGMDNRSAADKINSDGIDILIDMAGYTRDSRIEIFAHRPAPVQVAFLGYPGTTGADFIDYIIADGTVLPESAWPEYSETPVLMPDCYQVNDCEQEISDEPVSRSDENLPESGFVYCCFNGPLKFNPENFSAWMEILGQVDGSVLWLLDGGESMQANLRSRAQQAGISPDRLVFAEFAEKSRHLKRLQLADLFIDYGICVAHTTAADALWAGVPLLACPVDDGFAAQVSSSLLRTIGLDEMICPGRQAFIDKAVSFSRDDSGLEDIRKRVSQARLDSPLFDTASYVASLEQAFGEIWRQHRGQAPCGPVRMTSPGS